MIENKFLLLYGDTGIQIKPRFITYDCIDALQAFAATGPEAIAQIMSSAKDGEALGQYALGLMYYCGEGVQQDYGQAIKWFRKVEEQGEELAQYTLGIIHYNGQGVPQDYEQATNWFRKAAEKGEAAAQYMLGLMYEDGRGVPQDHAQGINWLRKAAAQDHENAQSYLEQLEAKNLGAPATDTGPGFAAGTLVHTKEGLVPIEQIKVGDLVLSKPENGEGEQAYTRVTQTFAYGPARVVRLMYFKDEARSALDVLNTTVDHLFWVVGEAWTAAEDLKNWWSVERKLELCDGRQVINRGVGNVYVSEQPGVGWLPCHSGGFSDATSRPGDLWDFVNHRLVATRVPALKDFERLIEYEDFEEGEDADSFFLKLPVYNLEVEDFHTCYVGKHGVLVRTCRPNGNLTSNT